MPHTNKNPIYAAMEFANNMLWLNSQGIDPFEPVVVGLGYLRSGSANNVIPETAELGGSVRCFDEKFRQQTKENFEKFAESISKKYDVECEVYYNFGCAPTINHPESAEFFRNSCKKVEGVKQVLIPKPAMSAENFGKFLQHIPGAFAWVGICKDEKSSFGLHSPNFFAYDETALLGADIFVQLALDFLTD